MATVQVLHVCGGWYVSGPDGEREAGALEVKGIGGALSGTEDQGSGVQPRAQFNVLILYTQVTGQKLRYIDREYSWCWKSPKVIRVLVGNCSYMHYIMHTSTLKMRRRSVELNTA